MKTALITTTINVPRVLEHYRQLGANVHFFVVLDRKSADLGPWISELAARGAGIDNATVFAPDAQQRWSCSELIGWNCIQRRNIALLEAVRWGADVIVSIDDDNIPLDGGYFAHLQLAFGRTFGLEAKSANGWFDVGQLLQPPASHRGFPIGIDPRQYYLESVTNARIGVAAGICMGDPDVSAVTRIAQAPIVHGVSEILRGGVITDPRQTRTVFNSQNTAFLRELAPAFFMFPGVGRYDDIYASLVMQQIMRERGLVVHFGKPFVWQQRNQHDLGRDLVAEIEGMRHVETFAYWLDDFAFPPDCTSVLPQVRELYGAMRKLSYFPTRSIQAALAFLDDIEKVL